MKNNNMLRLILLIALFPLLFSCNQKRDVSRQNGWYYILDNRKDSISDEPIVTVKDFVALRLDSSEMSGQPFYEIVGRVSKYKLNAWGDATEKVIGKRIGFVYNNEVITCPQVNMRLESGYFSISNPAYDIKDLFYQIRQEKMDSIENVFKSRGRDSLFYSLPKNEMDSMIMEIDYWEAYEWKDM